MDQPGDTNDGSVPSDKQANEEFDVVDNLEAQNARNESIDDSPPLLGQRTSSIFKGVRARENCIKLHLAAREKEFTQLYPFT